MKYYVFSLTHSNLLKSVGTSVPEVMVNGKFKSYTLMTSHPEDYPFSDYKIVAKCKDYESLKTKRGYR